MGLIDAHAHLDFAEYGADLDAVVARAREAGLVHIVVVGQWREGARMQGALDAVKLAQRLVWGGLAAGTETRKVEALFPRVETA